MTHHRPWIAAALVLTVSMLAAQAGAYERVEQYDDYSIYYNAMASTRLSPDVANQYNLQRSRVRGVLMISVLNDGEPVPARVEARALNPQEQLQTVRMREHADGEGIYSLGAFRMEDGERMRFEVLVRPDGHDRQYTLEFSERLYSD